MIIRWICENCNRKWIYPVKSCIYCKTKIIKQKGTNIKVIGATKVSIPSPMHPIIPYNVLLLQDEFGNKQPKKTMKDYKVGEQYFEEKAKTEGAVAVVKTKYDIYEAIVECIELLNSFNKLGITQNDKILIKPSAVIPAYSYQAVTTNPKVIDAVINLLLENGIKKENIIIAEQALIGNNTKDAVSKCGILDVCKEHKIEFVDVSNGPFEEIEIDGFKFNVFKEALNRKIINIPVMKTNSQLGLSGAVENLTRLVDEDTQRRMFFDDIDNTFPNLITLLPYVFTIGDASIGMQLQGPLTSGEPAFLNLILASKSPTNLDIVFCEATMLNKPSYLKLIDSKNIEVVGNMLDALKYPIKSPVQEQTPHPDIKLIDGKACPACFNAMYKITSSLVGLRGEQIILVTGSVLTNNMLKKLREEERIVIFGDCAIKKIRKMIDLEELGIVPMAQISENSDIIEQLVFFRKLLTTKGETKITPIDKVRSSIKKLLSGVIH